MRIALATLSLLIALAGCRAVPPGVTHETTAELPASHYVSVPALASALELSYLDDGAYLELSGPEDSVLLVPDTTRAMVNGQSIPMERPCIRRGDEYVVAGPDATRLRGVVQACRAGRLDVSPQPDLLPAPVHPRESSTLPAAWVPHARPRDWEYIVVHHTDTATGSARSIGLIHRERGWDCLGYDFVIGNGTETADGQIEVGPRWKTQAVGAHARRKADDDNWWNKHSIGIALVGDFTNHPPSEAQLESLIRLTRALMRQYHIPLSHVVPHRHVKPTQCPGNDFPWQEFMNRLRRG